MKDCRKNVILYVTHYSELLGANRSLLSVVIEIKKNLDFEPIVLVPSLGAFTKELERYQIKFYVCHFRASTYQKRCIYDIPKGWLREIINLLCSLALFYKLRHQKIALIHSNSSVLNVGAYLSILLGVPHIWHFREFVKQHFHWSYNWGDKYQYRLYSNHSDYIVVISRALENYYVKTLPFANINLIYNGVNIGKVDDHCVKIDDLVLNIALVGIISPGKHQDIVIKAVAKLINEYGIKSVHLHIFGDFSEEKSYECLVKELIVETNISEVITLHGYCENVNEYLNRCQIGVLASEYEAFGRVTIEYMLCGLVPIVSNSGANIEIIQDGVNGMIFELNNVQQLCDKLFVLFSNPQLRRTLSNAAQLEAVNKYTVEKNVKNIISLYDNICAEN